MIFPSCTGWDWWGHVSIRRIRSSKNGINHWNQSNGLGGRPGCNLKILNCKYDIMQVVWMFAEQNLILMWKFFNLPSLQIIQCRSKNGVLATKLIELVSVHSNLNPVWITGSGSNYTAFMVSRLFKSCQMQISKASPFLYSCEQSTYPETRLCLLISF